MFDFLRKKEKVVYENMEDWIKVVDREFKKNNPDFVPRIKDIISYNPGMMDLKYQTKPEELCCHWMNYHWSQWEDIETREVKGCSINLYEFEDYRDYLLYFLIRKKGIGWGLSLAKIKFCFQVIFSRKDRWKDGWY